MPKPFVYEQFAARVVLGELADVPGEVDRLGVDRVLLVVTGSAKDAGDRLQELLGARAVGRLDDVRQHVPLELASKARLTAETVGATGLVSIGGGSAVGLAKAVALTSGLPIVAVPTTYAGSEMTPVWGITSNGEKRTGTDPVVLPKTVVYDPALSRDLPLDVTAASVANALAHCVEAVWTPKANPFNEVIAVEGTRALSEGLRQVLREPRDLDARGNLLYGAGLAGSALASAGTGLHHKLCHLLGGRYGLPHAETHAAVLPQVTRVLAPTVPEAAARLSVALGKGDLATQLFDLFEASGVPTSLRQLGLTEDQAREAAADEALVQTILARAWAGVRPSKDN